MRKSLSVFQRDVTRIVRQPKTWIIVLGVLLTPALYAWFNITAFWDPYGNTQNIEVAVVNLDRGATSDETGRIDVGAQVVDQLKDDDQLGWTFFDDEDAALRAVRSGDVYAAIIIPADFSSDLISITSGDFTQPALRYYVNEKASAIAPKITDVGASELDRQISSAFIEQVAEAATTALKDAGDQTQLKLLNAKSDTLSAVDQASATLDEARQNVSALQSGLEQSRGALGGTTQTLRDTSATLDDVQTAIAQAQQLIGQAQQDIVTFTDAATTAYVQGATLLADASAEANVSVSRVTQALGRASTRIDGAIEDVRDVVDANAQAIEQLQAIVDAGGLDPATEQRLNDVIAALEQQNATDQQLLDDLQALNTNTAATVEAVQDAADALDAAVQNAQASATDLRTALTQTIPQLTSAMAALSSSAGAFSTAVDAQQTQLAQASQLIDALDTQLGATMDALASLDGTLAGIQTGVADVRTDVLALGSAAAWGQLGTITGLDPQQIASFIASPVDVAENVVFPVEFYGSAMAALFTNLSLWIGAFVLMVIFKVEVDTEGVEPITVGQAYGGRFLLLGTLAVGQALIVCIGNLLIGVQTVNALAFVGTGVLISLAYVSIVYALCVSFGHVGRGLCVLLVIMQIPGASGLYPIELMPSFFRSIYPFLPFTYGIDAMRETIAGFYGGAWWRAMGALSIFVALAWGLGLVLRRRLANLNLVFNREILATPLLIGEDVQVTGGGYRLTDIIHVLNDRGHYRDRLTRRAAAFTHRYPTLLRVSLLTGLAGITIIGLIAWLIHEQSATLLFVWLLWCLIVIAFLVSIEYIQQSFALASEVAALDDDHLRQAMLAAGPWRSRYRNAATDAGEAAEAADDEHPADEPAAAAPAEPEADAPEDDAQSLFAEVLAPEPQEPSPDDPSPDDAAERPEDQTDQPEEGERA
ncbi:MAG: hypothetical protein DI566_12285 [Microbacterium sp.]|nr:MAG: hypothetical protein DI566_12285 [Microbacterium sp.]